jgi:hypothetical protein
MKNPSERSLRAWAMLPLTLIFTALVFRMSWYIPITVAPERVWWWLAIGATVTGYLFILRFLSRPVSVERLKAPGVRAGTISGTAAGLIIATVYLYHQIPESVAVISRVVLGLAIFVNAGGYFLLVLLIKPGLIPRLRARPVRVGASVLVAAALAGLTIHTVRFLPSPEAVYLQSKVMAVLLLAALIAVSPLILQYIWLVWRKEDRGTFEQVLGENITKKR